MYAYLRVVAGPDQGRIFNLIEGTTLLVEKMLAEPRATLPDPRGSLRGGARVAKRRNPCPTPVRRRSSGCPAIPGRRASITETATTGGKSSSCTASMAQLPAASMVPVTA